MNLNELFDLKAQQVANTTYVIVAQRRDGTKLLVRDPGLDRPWSSKNRLLADSHAKACERSPGIVKAGAMTLAEAFHILQSDFATKHKSRPHG